MGAKGNVYVDEMEAAGALATACSDGTLPRHAWGPVIEDHATQHVAPRARPDMKPAVVEAHVDRRDAGCIEPALIAARGRMKEERIRVDAQLACGPLKEGDR